MAKTRQQKQEIIDFYKGKLEEATGVIFADNPGLKVNSVTELKKKLYNIGAEFHVLKNRLFKIAFDDKENEELLMGPTTAIFTTGDITEIAKLFKEFSKEQKNKPEIKGGILEKKFISQEKAKSLADLPSKEELLAKTVYMFNSPLSGFAQTITGVQRNLLYALNAVKENK